MSGGPGLPEHPGIIDLSSISGLAPDVFPDRSKISVYPPFGYAPTKTSPSIRPRVSVAELPPTPRDYWWAWFAGEAAFWSWIILFVVLVTRATKLSLALAAGEIVLYVALVKATGWLIRTGRAFSKLDVRVDPPPALAGLRPSRFDRFQYAVVKVPLQNFRFFKFALFHFPYNVLKLVLNYVRNGGFKTSITDEECWKLLVNTACIIPAVLSEDGTTLDLESPDDLPLTTPKGLSLAGVKLRFEVATHRLLYCFVDGKDVAEDKEMVAGIIHTLLVVWCHTKSHLASEAAARQIRSAGAKAVAPCAAFTASLHEFLVFTKKGPIQTNNQTGVKGVTVYQATAVPMAHTLDARKVQFRYYELLFKSRLIVRRLVHKHSVPVSGELLFNTCVVHSLDHLNGYEWQRGRQWSIDLSKSFASRLMCSWFSDFYTRPMTNPFYSEYLKDAEGEFFTDLYAELSELDKKLADSLLLSTSY